MMSKRLSAFLLLSLAIHALLLWLPGFAPSSGASSPFGGGSGRVEVRLKLLEPPSGRNNPPMSDASSVEQEKNQGATQSDTAEKANATAVESHTVSPLPVLPASLPRGFDRDAYLPGDQLDVRPSPEQPIIIGLNDPQGISKDKGRVVLVMYVGSEGTVDHVDIDSSDVPPDVAESLTAVFRSAKFHPGVKDDQPVKARMKILVEFEVR